MTGWILAFLLSQLGPKAVEGGIRFTYYDPEAKAVYIAGDFNNWNTTATPMERNEQGVWSVILRLPPGRYEYKFVVDGNWVADPFNPVTAGPYGNSVILVGEDGTLKPIEPTSNTPMNSMVYFHGDLWAMLPFQRDTIEGFRLMNAEHDVKLDLNVDLSERSFLWSRFRFNTETMRDPQSQIVPIILERAEAKFQGWGLLIKGFYNRWVLEFDDPFVLVGKEGEYLEPFGRDEAGLFVKGSPGFLRELLFLASDEYISGRDLLAARAKVEGVRGKAGVSARFQDGLEPQYNFVSPDSQRAPGDTLFLHFNGGYREFTVAGDFRYILRPWLILAGEFGGGATYLTAGEYDVDGTLTHWEPVNRAWKRDEHRRAFGGVEGRWEKLTYGLSYEWEQHRYDSLFLPDPNTRTATYGRTQLYLSIKGERLAVETRWTRTTLSLDTLFPWERIFDYTWFQRLQYYEFPLVGYPQKWTFETRLKWRPFSFLELSLEDKLAQAGLNKGPQSRETILKLDLSLGRFGLSEDLRMYRLKSAFLETDLRTFTPYHELRFAVTPNAILRLGFGLRPIDLNDDYRARREYLKELGVTDQALRTNFRRLGRLIETAEKALSRYNRITLSGEVRF